ncbi:MAG: MBL fold metallo-hydrolase, partial [Verrucomicrobiota bacterium]
AEEMAGFNAQAFLDSDDEYPSTTLRWYGHAFIYLISKSGVRVAVNPFMREAYSYTYPDSLPADIVLISSESADMAGGRDLTGLPQAFRSVAAIGTHRANGITFQGTRTYRDGKRGKEQGTNTVFSFKMDGIRYAHLGGLGHIPDSRQRRAIGSVDVLFLPLGFFRLETEEWLQIAKDLRAKLIIPICLKTERTSNLSLRSWSEVKLEGIPVESLDHSEIQIRKDLLPAEMTILLLQSP